VWQRRSESTGNEVEIGGRESMNHGEGELKELRNFFSKKLQKMLEQDAEAGAKKWGKGN
jgi:hypothetical protein